MADLTTKQKVLGGVLGAAIFVAGGVTMALNLPVSSSGDSVAFEAQFATAADFYDRFDYGYSGQDSWRFPDGIGTYHGDHNTACQAPTTLRDVTLSGSGVNAQLGQIFWHCAPGGSDTGHMMTGVDTVGYNIAWFSPKPAFSQIMKVCWDINETEMSFRKWTQVVFVGAADASRYPAGITTFFGYHTTRGSGGFDLGYPSPDYQNPNGATTGILPAGGTLAGIEIIRNAPSWFQNQSSWTTRFQGAPHVLDGITDKAARYRHCIENIAPNTVRLTQATPTGSRTFDMVGQIPQDARRVVFQDDNYNPGKGQSYNRDVLTWHWDNIQVFTAGAPPPTTTTPPTIPTTQPTTTTAITTTTTLPTTTTSSTTTTVPSSTSSSTTLPPSPCPTTFNVEQFAWCQTVESRLDALEG